ncbi:hypothetical protein KBH77_02835 [Patescibacteria group bacterium]|nr:hypothetical protein [Patescibacteria group bacterium]
MFYNKQGEKITRSEFTSLIVDKDYVAVKQKKLKNGKFISTVWLGLDYSICDGKVLIFETMVFPEFGDCENEFCERYSTLEEAMEGHERIVKEYEKITGKKVENKMTIKEVKDLLERFGVTPTLKNIELALKKGHDLETELENLVIGYFETHR